MQNSDPIYDYAVAGFDAFLNRSIDISSNPNSTYATLSLVPPLSTGMQLNYDQNQISGSLGDSLQIGNITLDGASGRISIFDNSGNEIVRLGEL